MSLLRDDPLLLVVVVVAAVECLAGRIRAGGFGFDVAAVLLAMIMKIVPAPLLLRLLS